MTPTFDIRQETNQHPANLLLGDYAFASSPKPPDKEKQERYLRQRSDDKIYFSYLEDEPVAKVAVVPMTQNVRGLVLPMGGVSGVCSMPAARRGGHVRALMQHALETMHTDGQAVSALYPFKTSYYEMFGYAGWQVPIWARIKPVALAPYLRIPKTGTMKQRLSADARDDFYAFLQATQQGRHGMACHPRVRFDNGVENYPTWFASLHEGDAITAAICYKMDLDKEVMEVHAAFWHTMNGKLNLLDFMARHVDQVKEIRMAVLPGEHPHLWVTDDWQVTLLSNEDYSWGPPMARVISVAGLRGIGAGDGEVCVRVRDAQAGWNTGVWTFTGQDGVLSVREGGEPTGDVTINGLSAMVFSGIDPRILSHRGWGEVSEDAAVALQAIFPPIVPHLHELF